MHTIAIGSIAILLYITASVFIFLRWRDRDTSAASKLKLLIAGALATVAHGGLLYQLLFTATGMDLGIFNAISLITWVISLVLVASSIKQPTENLALFVFPAAALALIVELSIPSTYTPQQHWQDSLEIHILVSIIAYSLLSIAAIQAILLAIQDKHLREKRPGGFIRAMPPLQTMEALLFQMIAVGFAMQTLSLLSGFMFLDSMFAQHLVHKTVLSILGWFFFGILLWGRWRFGWRGRKAIRWTLSGFISLALSYIGSKMVLELILGKS